MMSQNPSMLNNYPDVNESFSSQNPQFSTQSQRFEDSKELRSIGTKPCWITLNMPPIIDTSRMYEVFMMDNGALDFNSFSSRFLKSIMINRTAHKAWDKIKNYAQTLKEQMDDGVSYHYADYGKNNITMGGTESYRKGAIIRSDKKNDSTGQFILAPVFKVSLSGAYTDPERTLTIGIYDSNMYSSDSVGNNSFGRHLQEEYIKKYLANKGYRDEDGNPLYKRNPNNQYTLKPPMAATADIPLSTDTTKKNLFFNTNILDDEPLDICSIKFSNCNVLHGPTIYSGDVGFTSIDQNDVIFDMKNSNAGPLTQSIISTNNTASIKSMGGVLQDKLKYKKLCFSARQTIAPSGSAIFPKVEVNNFRNGMRPAEMTDLRNILDTLGRWLQVPGPTGVALSRTYMIPNITFTN